MKKILVLMADGCEEIETVTVIDILRRAELEVVVAGLNDKPVMGSRKIRFLVDVSIDQVQGMAFEAVVLPGGSLGVDKLRRDPRVLEILRSTNKKNRVIGAICAAPLALKDAGLIQGRRLTSYPSIKDRLTGARYSDDAVVVDGNLVTSRGPGTAMVFSLALVKILAGEEKAREVAALALVS